MKFNDAFDPEKGGWIMEAKHQPNGMTRFLISIKEGPRRWRRENITLTKADSEKLASYLTNE